MGTLIQRSRVSGAASHWHSPERVAAQFFQCPRLQRWYGKLKALHSWHGRHKPYFGHSRPRYFANIFLPGLHIVSRMRRDYHAALRDGEALADRGA